MTTFKPQISPHYFRIALQSALAAVLFLGLPAGLLLWLILLRGNNSTSAVDPFIEFLQVNGLNKIFLLTFCSLGWSFSLGRISGYQPAWHIGLATMLAIIIGWFSPLSNLDGWFDGKLPMHSLYAVAMCGIVFSATSCVGLAYGLILRSVKAALTLALTTGLVTVLTLLLTIIIFNQFGIRVGDGTVFLAMSRVTATSLMLSAIMGGMVLGVGFSWFVENKQSDNSKDTRKLQ